MNYNLYYMGLPTNGVVQTLGPDARLNQPKGPK